MDTVTYKIAVSKYQLSAKIPYGDAFWGKFNASFENVELHVSDILEVVYYGRAITTQHTTNWRVGKNFLCGQYLGLDFDSGDQASSMTTLLNDKFIQRYGAFLYSTMSHTPEAPRSRAIFLLDTPIQQATNYVNAVTALLWLFGTADRQCKDSVRFFYGSPQCEFEYINQVLPLDVVKKLIADYQSTGQAEKRKTQRRDYLPPPDQQEVAEALKVIPPWQIEYDEWVGVLMGLHSAFGDSGYTLAESWADGKRGEVEHKWKSFDQSGNTSGAITIATVFALAKRFGWHKEILV